LIALLCFAWHEKCEPAHGQAAHRSPMVRWRRGLPPSRRPPSAVPAVRAGRGRFFRPL